MTRFITRAVLALALIAGAAPVAVVSSFEAEAGGWRWLEPRPEADIAVARSRFGNGTVSGPVRGTRVGYEVRKPNGTWIACRTSCSETLRVETVDLHENLDGTPLGMGTLAQECGIFGCLDLHLGRGR
ncbi:hypothetical protein W911_09130 [Hyphomicrobium nitrativorans NL23]|uniref:Uncharacterized protein n=1 Tax=Hyphomicrobium nitrativorans NL23 TaxID=1029756 RepID=V5SDB0_9HYPH|nr:hypothetical protein [Hyphomicrobium nitrativorans]AHB48518.1 hypothetical protein W911_09130 [Hyphomicrobium nitrativorans NL23]